LLEKGVAEEIIQPAIRALADGELEAARAVWRKKFGRPPGNMSERARQTRFLLNRGFTSDVIRRVLARASD